jgi:hypothetical protein
MKVELVDISDEMALRESDAVAGVSPAPTDEDLLDWDASIERPPARPAGIIQVKLEYAGRSKPIPVTDPASE